MSIFIGIDPGSSGGIAVLTQLVDDEPAHVEALPLDPAKTTERDVADFLRGHAKLYSRCVIERVQPTRNRDTGGGRAQGSQSMFTFGRSYGFLRGLLIGMNFTFVERQPQKWLPQMGVHGIKDETTTAKKNRHKALAQQLYPAEKITHWKTDALLLATYCRRHHAELF